MRRPELLPALLLLLVALVRVAAELTGYGYDWDLDHMLYFGGRLLAGELHWTVEFDDKLPVVQFLFALPAWAHSVRVWQAMSVLAVVAGGTALYRFLRAAFREQHPGLAESTAGALALSAAVLCACAFTLLPGGISHVNPFAASLAMLAIYALDLARRIRNGSRARCAAAFLLGALSASLAIGIRPYFLFPLLLAGSWAGFKAVADTATRWRLRPMLGWSLAWVAAVGLSGLAVNALPYLVTGRLEVLRAGLTMLTQDFNPQGAAEVLAAQGAALLQLPTAMKLVMATWGVAVLGLLPVLSRGLGRSASRSAAADIGYLVFAAPLLLETAVLSRHFWPHYLQFFPPFLWLAIGLAGASLAAGNPVHLGRLSLLLACLLAISLPVDRGLSISLQALTRPGPARHPQTWQLEAFRRYLASRPADRRDFLNPSHMYLHWQLDEQRHGFPHAANTGHIVSRGWFRDLQIPALFDLPADRDAYCALLEAKGPSLVVEIGASAITGCFDASSSHYRPAGTPETEALGLLIFARISEPGTASRQRPEI